MTAHLIEHGSKDYATRENAIKAVQRIYGPNVDRFGATELHYVIAVTPAGRFYPVFIGERAVRAGVHFKFAVVA